MILYQELNSLIELLPDIESPILDAGCAYGNDCAVLASKGIQPVGIDMSNELDYPCVGYLEILDTLKTDAQ